MNDIARWFRTDCHRLCNVWLNFPNPILDDSLFRCRLFRYILYCRVSLNFLSGYKRPSSQHESNTHQYDQCIDNIYNTE